MSLPCLPRPGSNRDPLRHDLTPHPVPIAALRPLGRAARRHPAAQLAKLARSLERFGFVLPVLIDGQGRVIGGWALVQAARRLDLVEVPAVTLGDLDEAEARALRLALDRLAEDADWNRDELRLELDAILEFDMAFELEAIGFETAEIDLMLGESVETEADDAVPEGDGDAPPVTRPGDLWGLGPHRVLCADATEAAAYARLLGDDRARLVFTDPPYNVPIPGHVSGLGRHRHGDFAMASGEMSEAAFTDFLATVFGHLAAHGTDGALHYVCMDWRHLHEALTAGKRVYSALKNLCVWNKTNAGMGSLYRSKHELVLVFKAGTAPHVNTVALGRHGRSRSNVWDYPGLAAFGAGRDAALARHPTVKPVALVADAIRDALRRGDLVLDPFLGSGTTVIAAAKTGRRCAGLELDPVYVDRILERWQAWGGETPVLEETGESFTAVAARRATKPTERRAENHDD
ncbi:MAG: DNA methyltransferase [Marinovum algicola]